MTSRQLRLLRAAAASFIATLLAAVSHTLAGGPAPHPLLVLALAVFLIAPAAALIGTSASRTRVALTVLVSQAVFHTVFQLLGSPIASGAPHGAHRHHLLTLGTVTVAALPDALMLLGHTGAAAVTILLIWHGESVVRTIAAWVTALLRRAASIVPAVHERPSPLSTAVHTGIDTVPVTAVSRRGPPVSA